MTVWNKARQRQQETPRKYKPCGPVGDDARNYVSGMPPGTYEVLRGGERISEFSHGDGYVIPHCEPETCAGCRYHVCSCKPKELVFQTCVGPLTVRVDPTLSPGDWRIEAPNPKESSATKSMRHARELARRSAPEVGP